MKRILNFLFFVALVFAVSTNLGAASLSLTPGPGGLVPGFIPTGVAPNAFLGPGNLFPFLPSVAGWFGSTVNYSVAGLGSSVKFDFFGGEAGFDDQFLYDSGGGYALPTPLFDHTGSPINDVSTSLLLPKSSATFGLSPGSGVLAFEFLVNSLSGPPAGGPVNGLNPLNLPGLPPNFFAACAPLLPGPGPAPPICGDTLWVFLDDNGAGDDNDYDDYLVRITVADGERKIETPEPNSFVLLSGGLIGLGLLRRKFKN